VVHLQGESLTKKIVPLLAETVHDPESPFLRGAPFPLRRSQGLRTEFDHPLYLIYSLLQDSFHCLITCIRLHDERCEHSRMSKARCLAESVVQGVESGLCLSCLPEWNLFLFFSFCCFEEGEEGKSNLAESFDELSISPNQS